MRWPTNTQDFDTGGRCSFPVGNRWLSLFLLSMTVSKPRNCIVYFCNSDNKSPVHLARGPCLWVGTNDLCGRLGWRTSWLRFIDIQWAALACKVCFDFDFKCLILYTVTF